MCDRPPKKGKPHNVSYLPLPYLGPGEIAVYSLVTHALCAACEQRLDALSNKKWKASNDRALRKLLANWPVYGIGWRP
jgi:hypothetical protein